MAFICNYKTNKQTNKDRKVTRNKYSSLISEMNVFKCDYFCLYAVGWLVLFAFPFIELNQKSKIITIKILKGRIPNARSGSILPPKINI